MPDVGGEPVVEAVIRYEVDQSAHSFPLCLGPSPPAANRPLDPTRHGVRSSTDPAVPCPVGLVYHLRQGSMGQPCTSLSARRESTALTVSKERRHTGAKAHTCLQSSTHAPTLARPPTRTCIRPQEHRRRCARGSPGAEVERTLLGHAVGASQKRDGRRPELRQPIYLLSHSHTVCASPSSLCGLGWDWMGWEAKEYQFLAEHGIWRHIELRCNAPAQADQRAHQAGVRRRRRPRRRRRRRERERGQAHGGVLCRQQRCIGVQQQRG